MNTTVGDADLVLVCRVEWNLADLSVPSTVFADVSNGQLDALEKSRLRGISIALPATRTKVE